MSVNKVILVGRLGAEPESRTFPDGGSICNLRIATTESWKDKQSGERKERTEWHRVVMRNHLGNIANKYLNKGSQVYIEGRIQTRKWQDQNGQDRYSTEIIANEMTMLDGKGQDHSSQGQDYSSGGVNTSSGGQSPQQQVNSQLQPQQTQPAQSVGGANTVEDDIPFMPHLNGTIA